MSLRYSADNSRRMAPAASPAPTSDAPCVEAGLTHLAQRYPLLPGDLQRWLAAPGRSVQADTSRELLEDHFTRVMIFFQNDEYIYAGHPSTA